MTATLPRERVVAVFFPEKEDESAGIGLLAQFDQYREHAGNKNSPTFS